MIDTTDNREEAKQEEEGKAEGDEGKAAEGEEGKAEGEEGKEPEKPNASFFGARRREVDHDGECG